MPRTSPYRLILTDAERTELEGRARRYTSPYSDVVRAKIVLYAADGLGNDEIAATMPCSTAARARSGQCQRASGASAVVGSSQASASTTENPKFS